MIQRDDLRPVKIEEVFGELCAVDDKGEAPYRTKYLQNRLQTVVTDISLNIDKMPFHESDKALWLRDAISVLDDEMNQAQVKALMEISAVQLPKAYNFYHDSNQTEARLFYTPIAAL